MTLQNYMQVERLPLGGKALASPEVGNTRQRTVPKMPLQVPTTHNKNKRKGQRTGDGGLCYGSIRIIGLCYSLCNVCGE